MNRVYARWMRQAMTDLIQDRCGSKLAVRTVRLYIERRGFTPQKPVQQAYEQ